MAGIRTSIRSPDCSASALCDLRQGALTQPDARRPIGAGQPPMPNVFDQIGKQIGEEALAGSGTTVLQDEIPSEVRYADLRHEPRPERAAARARLGLLGRLASRLCLIELFGHAPGGAELPCLGKHFAFWQAHARRARRRRARRRRTRPDAPTLWIITAGTPRAILRELALTQAPGWPTGVYWFGGELLRVGLIVASQLPRTRETLLVRLMAGGPLLRDAIEELRELPAGAHERAVADRILLRWKHALRNKPIRRPQEKELIMAVLDTWERMRREGLAQGRKEGETRGIRKGEARGLATAVLTVLRARRIQVPPAVRKRILEEKSPARLERWLARALVKTSLAAVLGEPS